MKINEDMINILPILLKSLANGESLNIASLHARYEIPERTLRENIKKNLLPLFPDDIAYDHKTKNYYAKRNFLSDTLLSAEELVTIKLLENHSDTLGRRFNIASKRLFNRFKRRASLNIFKKTKMEKIGKDDEGKLAIIKNAISSKAVLACRYGGKERIIHPLKIVMLEGYWYLFLWDAKDNIIKTFHLKTIEALDATGEQFEQPHTNILEKLDGAINAYFKDAPPIDVELLIHKKVLRYFERQPLSPSQILSPTNDPNYTKLEIRITDEMEIIPTIQQFLPYVKAVEPQTLCERIEENLQNYSKTDLI